MSRHLRPDLHICDQDKLPDWWCYLEDHNDKYKKSIWLVSRLTANSYALPPSGDENFEDRKDLSEPGSCEE